MQAPSRFVSHPRPAADEIMPMAEPRGSMSPSSMRSIRCRCPMKLMRSMPGVPSATPAHENNACTGPPHSSTAASIDALSERSSCDRLHAGERDLGAVHHHDLGARVLRQLGGRRAHAGGATDHQCSLALVAEGVEQAHQLLSTCDMVVRCRHVSWRAARPRKSSALCTSSRDRARRPTAATGHLVEPGWRVVAGREPRASATHCGAHPGTGHLDRACALVASRERAR